jgi:hypothetical protein
MIIDFRLWLLVGFLVMLFFYHFYAKETQTIIQLDNF